jgi:hypothetical protein
MRLLLISAVVVTCFGFHKSAEARPPYVGVYAKLYPNDPRQCRKCVICHVRGDRKKKLRNPYGRAIEKALPHPNVKDKEIIKKAIKSAEKLKPKPCRAAEVSGRPTLWHRVTTNRRNHSSSAPRRYPADDS